MNYIEIKGGTKAEKVIVQKTVDYCLKTLLPRYRTLELEIKLKNIKDDAVGYCLMGDTNRQFEIEIQRGMSVKDIVTTVCHEMVHVKQYARKEMDDHLTSSGRAKWRGKLVKSDTKYYDLPWEIEAYEMQDDLADDIWNKGLI